MSSNIQPVAPVKGDRFIRRLEAAKKLGISHQSLDRWVRDGKIRPPMHPGGRASVWPESYLDAFIAGTLPQQTNLQK